MGEFKNFHLQQQQVSDHMQEIEEGEGTLLGAIEEMEERMEVQQ